MTLFAMCITQNSPRLTPTTVAHTCCFQVRLQSTAELLKAFPFALIMPMADRNLAEVSPLTALRIVLAGVHAFPCLE